MLNNRQKFVTGSSLTNMTWDQISQWYTQLVETDIKSYLENPNDYQNSKNSKHLGTVCMFDSNFTSKYLSQSILCSQVGSAAISGTLGLDDKGRPSLWLQNEECVGLLWGKHTDIGTSCNYTKIVLLEEKPGFSQSQTHAFPIENIQGFNALYFSEKLLDPAQNSNKSQWIQSEHYYPDAIQHTEHDYMEDENARGK
ncbi:MAG: hypothetical protein GQ565_12590 [Candidatus Aegiribacteria sp.]|nr:hypothetical protein [Candidatus Aegiribacteria sp.]